MEEISFEDLYVANDDFQKVFFEKAYFPTSPVTSSLVIIKLNRE